MHTSKFGVYQLLSITSVCKSLLEVCASIRSRFRNIPHIQHASVHIRSWRHTWEGCSRWSVESSSPSLVSISSSPSPLSAKTLFHVCASIRSSFRNLQSSISYTRGIFGRAVVGCSSNADRFPSAPHYHLCLLNFVPRVCIDPFKI